MRQALFKAHHMFEPTSPNSTIVMPHEMMRKLSPQGQGACLRSRSNHTRACGFTFILRGLAKAALSPGHGCYPTARDQERFCARPLDAALSVRGCAGRGLALSFLWVFWRTHRRTAPRLGTPSLLGPPPTGLGRGLPLHTPLWSECATMRDAQYDV